MTRAYGEGSLYFSESRDRWVAAWRGRKRYARTQRAAAIKLDELRRGSGGTPRLRTVGEVLDWWLDDHLEQRLASDGIAPKTVVHYRGSAAHLRPIRRLKVTELTAADVDRITARMARQGNPRTVSPDQPKGGPYSPSARRGVVVALQGALRAAARKGLIDPTRAAEWADKPTVGEGDVEIVTPELAARVLTELESTRYQRPVLVALSLGLRVSEALGMCWDDIDLDAGHVRIAHQLQRHDGTWVLRPVKNRTDAHLALSTVAAAALREQRARQAEERLAAGPLWSDDVPGDLVWRRVDGQPEYASTITRAVKAACLRAGVPPMTMHPFARHGHATLLRLAGATMDDVREQLRHRQASTTTRYTHVVPEMRRRNADLMDGILRG